LRKKALGICGLFYTNGRIAIAGSQRGPTPRYNISIDLCLGQEQAMPPKKKSEKLHRCPTCGMPVHFTDEDFPFCSDRCRKIDLGKWAMGVYKISSPILDPEVLEDLGGLSGDPNGDSYDD
jgi:endogenous inhibitor of DNA gyrase (YacG/DUF329 family)